MIIDKLENRGRYADCHKNIAIALDYIAAHANDPALEDGCYPIVPDEVIVHVLSKETKAREDAMMEIHKRFMDIHYMIRGSEACGVAPLGEEIDYNPETDNGFWACEENMKNGGGHGRRIRSAALFCTGSGDKSTKRG